MKQGEGGKLDGYGPRDAVIVQDEPIKRGEGGKLDGYGPRDAVKKGRDNQAR